MTGLIHIVQREAGKTEGYVLYYNNVLLHLIMNYFGQENDKQ